MLGSIGILLVAYLLSLFFVNTLSTLDVLQDRLANIITHDTRWALVAIDLQTGREVAAAGIAAKEKLVPASFVKLITARAMLDCTDQSVVPEKSNP